MERRHPRYWLVESKEKSSHTHLYVLSSILLSSLFVLFWKLYADRQVAYEVRSKQEDKAAKKLKSHQHTSCRCGAERKAVAG